MKHKILWGYDLIYLLREGGCTVLWLNLKGYFKGHLKTQRIPSLLLQRDSRSFNMYIIITCISFIYILIYQLYYTPRKLPWRFIQSINHWPLKKYIHNCLSDSENSFLFFSFYFSCMVAITAAVLASTLVNGL